ncbi:MAG: hypothetical protein HC923_11605 [Myxococcales bacterium]|nr:hypothetical protein [Myxococcales bacterium]
MKNALRAAVLTLFVAMTFAVSAPILAADEPGPILLAQSDDEPSKELPPGFVPVKGADPTQQVDAHPLVVMAYGSILGGLFVYILILVRRQGKLATELRELADEMRRRGQA